MNQYPWETPRWIGVFENAKINISLRIFSNKWHVYAGLAITNPSAHDQGVTVFQVNHRTIYLNDTRKKERVNRD